MTYASLLKRLQRLSPERLKQQVQAVIVDQVGTLFVSSLNTSGNKTRLVIDPVEDVVEPPESDDVAELEQLAHVNGVILDIVVNRNNKTEYRMYSRRKFGTYDTFVAYYPSEAIRLLKEKLKSVGETIIEPAR